MKNILLISVIFTLISWKPAAKLKSHTVADCETVWDLSDAIGCAEVAKFIACYNEKWPRGMNSTIFFELIRKNQNLTDLSFCYVDVDSLPGTIGDVSNLEDLQLSSGTITSIPNGIGRLKKLKTLILGTYRDECMGNPVKYIDPDIGNCVSLVHLGLSYSEVSDLPVELSNCKNLRLIDLSNNSIITPEKIIELKERFPGVRIISGNLSLAFPSK